MFLVSLGFSNGPCTHLGTFFRFRHEKYFLMLTFGMVKEENKEICIFTNENSVNVLRGFYCFHCNQKICVCSVIVCLCVCSVVVCLTTVLGKFSSKHANEFLLVLFVAQEQFLCTCKAHFWSKCY